MWFFVSRSCIILYRIMKFQTPKLEKKYNIFNTFWRFFFFFFGWGCFRTYAVKTQNRRLEQDEVKFH